ncbi:TetR/AcrR family transcriptional regulator [Paenarthrobacter sp. RAF54_2]|uniref:TetR/AcrR family transcriptional regulator n=1 Tax=Paenarthrobacter sp. RAF54_2 TaxID=3233061 RepID=UPI003F973F55
MPKGVIDTDRRNRLVHAAAEIVAQRGVDGLTHRAVAAAAGVPLGSTTYHFRSLDDLLLAAVEQAKERWDSSVAFWERNLAAGTELARALSEFTARMTNETRPQAIVEYELYIAALRRPALRKLSLDWDETLPRAVARHTDWLTAQALSMAVDGLVVRSLVSGNPLDVTAIEPIFQRILRG